MLQVNSQDCPFKLHQIHSLLQTPSLHHPLTLFASLSVCILFPRAPNGAGATAALFWAVREQMAAEQQVPLLKKVYYQNCSGCRVEQLKETRRGLPIRELLSIWTVVLCTGK